MKNYVKILLLLLSFVIFFFAFAPIFCGIFNIVIFAMLLLAALPLAFAFCADFLKLRSEAAFKVISRVFCAFFGVIFGVFALVGALQVKFAHFNSPSEPLPIIVLGCKINGSAPGTILKSRLDSAYEYLTQNPGTYAIVSGGQGYDELVSEAIAMKNYLVEKGISPDRILLEEHSSNTEENINFSAQILKNNGLPQEAVIATSDFHQLRAALYAQRAGLTVYSVSSPIQWYLTPYYFIREIFALVKFVLV